MAQKKLKGPISNNYDLNTRIADTIFPANNNQMTTYEISNVNRFVYDVTINGTLVSFNTAVPAVFDLLLKPETPDDSNISETIEGLSGMNDGTAKVAMDQNKLAHVEADIKYYSGNNEKGLFDVYKVYDIQLESLSSVELQKIIAQLKKDKKSLEDSIRATLKSISTPDSLFTLVTQASLKVDQHFDWLEKSKVFKNSLITISQSNTINSTIAADEIQELEKQSLSTKNLLSLKAQFDEAVNEFNYQHQIYLSNDKVQKKFKKDSEKIIKSVKNLKNEVDRIDALAKKTDYAKIAEDISVIKSELLNVNSYIAISNPIQATEDDVKFEVKITPKSTINSNLHTTTTNFTTHIPVKGGVKIDFSTGFITTGLLHNRSYSSTIASDSSSFTISQDKNRNVANFNVGAFMHVYKSNATNSQLAATFGFGLNSKTLDDVDFYLGGSAIFGRKNRFVVTAGAALSHVNYLKGSFNKDETIDIARHTDELTERAIRLGAFVAFSYNLSK